MSDDPRELADSDTVSIGGDDITEPPLGPGDVVGERWQLDQYLSGGGMGTVWRALDLRLGEPAAVKLMRPQYASTDVLRQRFVREARAAAQVRGDNVVSIRDFAIDRASGVPYIAMELLRGEDLGRRLRRGPLGFLLTRSVLIDVCSAMARAHRLGIVHRDLKPANIFLVPVDDGFSCKVLDFGIAKLAPDPASLTDTGSTLGTVSYMSPEQITDAKHVDHRADLWAIAVIAYECLVGRPAFVGRNMAEIVHKICYGEWDPPSSVAEVPTGFDEWFARAARRDPEARFSSTGELLEAFGSLGSMAGAGTNPDSPRALPVPATDLRHQLWASDANQIDIRLLGEVTFKNSVVDEYLEEGSKYFVSGAKGCGKTLLLTFKRSLLAARYQATEGGGAHAVQLIPEGRPYLDLMSDLRTLGKAHVDFLSTLANCKRVWSFALRVSALSHHPNPTDDDAFAALSKPLRGMLRGQSAEPTIVVKELLTLSVGQINQALDATETLLERRVRALHSGMFFFIDKLDQALRRLSRAAWVHMQAGLVEAAWDLMNTNAHLKVFATIREEAFSSYESDIKTNLFGATSTIRYSKDDLRALLDKLTHFYEGLHLRDFVSVDVVSPKGAARGELAFDFLHRHTLGRPRDLVIIASEISRQRAQLDERAFRTLVLETSAGILASNVFDEMRVFLDVLCDRRERARFLSMLPYEVLTAGEVVDIWCRFHGVDEGYYETYGRDAAELDHPFRELYDCGLLGVIGADAADGAPAQLFKQPHEPMDGFSRQLPRSPFYILHPTLRGLISRLGQGTAFTVIRGLTIGHQQPWTPLSALLVELQAACARAGGAEHADVLDLLQAVLTDVVRAVDRGGRLEDAATSAGRSSSSRRLFERLDALGWDELHLLLLERLGAH